MFALLPPGSDLVLHRDPYAGSLRYHRGLSTPNSPDCKIVVDGIPAFWRDGEAILFDETYLHTAQNLTDRPRVILFCDVERKLWPFAAFWLNRSVGHFLLRQGLTKNVEGEPVSLSNRLFGGIYAVRRLGKRIKAGNRSVYYPIKYALFGSLLWSLFLR
jgi:beta-hydroxylase